MKRCVKYIVGLFLILVGLLIKSALNHNIIYWGLTLTITLILFAIGIVLIFPLNYNYLSWLNYRSFSNSPTVWIIENAKRILIYAVLILGILGLEKLGVEFNYQIRNHYLSKNTQKTVGYVKGIKQISISKTGNENFYMINFLVNNKIETKGLLIKYSEKDNTISNELKSGVIKPNKLLVNTMKFNQVEIIYSIEYPSFFRINE